MTLWLAVASPLQDVRYESDILTFRETATVQEFLLGHILTKLLRPHEYIWETLLSFQFSFKHTLKQDSQAPLDSYDVRKNA